jgi:hypothetical protein
MLVKGPFSIKWGENPVVDVSEIGFNYDVATNDYQTVDGRTYTVDGAITASIDLTLLASDVEALSAILPQYYVAEGQPMSTGETAPEGGAIDIVAAQCDTTNTNYDLDIISCNGEVTRLVNARTSLSTVDIADNALRTVTVTFRGEPEQGEGIIQFFKNAES